MVRTPFAFVSFAHDQRLANEKSGIFHWWMNHRVFGVQGISSNAKNEWIRKRKCLYFVLLAWHPSRRLFTVNLLFRTMSRCARRDFVIACWTMHLAKLLVPINCVTRCDAFLVKSLRFVSSKRISLWWHCMICMKMVMLLYSSTSRGSQKSWEEFRNLWF